MFGCTLRTSRQPENSRSCLVSRSAELGIADLESLVFREFRGLTTVKLCIYTPTVCVTYSPALQRTGRGVSQPGVEQFTKSSQPALILRRVSELLAQFPEKGLAMIRYEVDVHRERLNFSLAFGRCTAEPKANRIDHHDLFKVN